MSPDNQEIIRNAKTARLADEITAERERDAVLLAMTNEADLELPSYDGESREE